MDRVGIDVVGTNTEARLQELNPEIPAYLTPVVLDVQFRRGSAWDAVRSQREFTWDDIPKHVLEGPHLQDAKDYSCATAFPDDEPLFWERAYWLVRLTWKPETVAARVQVDDHPVTVLPMMRPTWYKKQKMRHARKR